ncbi:hypothetical protein DEJ50_11775 [Streptomyces venezuelae]|uniref:Uncharacterized protein n=1 Tax=Streptomyces venezuelae TaxID=54571 RepID=A0A5P2D501_STRVZ|nr:hypothetical protein DEJ50_11775 [Streptomyces venezuelae]
MTSQVRITVGHAVGADGTESLHDEVAVLREDLLLLDVERVGHPEAGPAPAGTRGAAAELGNVLLVTLPPALPLLESLVRAVRNWLGRAGDARSVVLEIDGNRLELTGIRSEEQRRLTEVWIARCTEKTGGREHEREES